MAEHTSKWSDALGQKLEGLPDKEKIQNGFEKNIEITVQTNVNIHIKR